MNFWKKDITAFSVEELIERCKQKERNAQYQLYERFAPKMMGVCKRYVRQEEVAEEMLSNTFIKVFSHIGQYEAKGSFEGWIRQIAVRECIGYLRAQRNWYVSVDEFQANDDLITLPTDHLETEEIVQLIESLPNGYREVFNMYVIEGMKHHEIAKLLDISENTSKTQLMKAKAALRTKIDNLYVVDKKHLL